MKQHQVGMREHDPYLWLVRDFRGCLLPRSSVSCTQILTDYVRYLVCVERLLRCLLGEYACRLFDRSCLRCPDRRSWVHPTADLDLHARVHSRPQAAPGCTPTHPRRALDGCRLPGADRQDASSHGAHCRVRRSASAASERSSSCSGGGKPTLSAVECAVAQRGEAEAQAPAAARGRSRQTALSPACTRCRLRVMQNCRPGLGLVHLLLCLFVVFCSFDHVGI